jgi:hypothetical protein
LSEEAKQKGGFGATFAAAGEYALPLTDETKLRAGTGFFRNDYQGGQFDDMQVESYLGPQLLRRWGDMSLLGLVLKRWYGNATYYEGYGMRPEVGWNLSQRYRIEAYVQAAELWYPQREFLNGYQLDAAATQLYALAPLTVVHLTLGFGHQETQQNSWQNESGRIGLGFAAPLAWGVSLDAELSGIYFSYHGQTFGLERRDKLLAAALSLTKRDWDVLGFWPQVTGGYQRNLSTVQLFAYDREFAQIGVTRHF